MPENEPNLPAIQTAERPPGMQGLINLTTAPEGQEPAVVEKHMVILCRAGVGGKKYYVPPGTTFRDLFREVGATTENQDIRVGDQLVSLDAVIAPNTLVFAVPKPKNA
jgi:hypothetical protein